MPTYMDIHEIPGGVTAEAVAKAHAHDVAVEGKYGVHYDKYWVNESVGKIFCLCHAPSAEAAMQVQRELARREREEHDHHIKVRIGGAAGEPVEQNNDIFGTTVQLAARLCSHAEPDQILVSTAVAELCIGKGLTFRPLGEVALKGFDRPVQVHAVECAQ